MLAHSVGLKVVAEGTETEEQITELKQLKCEMAQGFLYSPPVDRKAALACYCAASNLCCRREFGQSFSSYSSASTGNSTPQMPFSGSQHSAPTSFSEEPGLASTQITRNRARL